MPATTPHGLDKPLSELLPDGWIWPNAQLVEQPIGRYALGAANDRALDVGEDPVPVIGFKHGSAGQFVGTVASGLISPAISVQVGGKLSAVTVAVYRTRCRYATGTALRAQLGKTPGTDGEFKI